MGFLSSEEVLEEEVYNQTAGMDQALRLQG